MRIIAGKHRGRKIETPNHADIRPTSDFAREGIFNILMHSKLADGGAALLEARVLDLFCGTGALGLEALSRGAAHVTFVDQSREALALVRTSAERFNELNACEFLSRDAAQLPRNSAGPYRIAFVDPPYSANLLVPVLKNLSSGGWLQPGAIVVAEHDERTEFIVPEGYTQQDRRRYGRACVEFLLYT